MLSSTLEEYSGKDDHGEHNQNCTDVIKKRKACRGRWEAFKRNREGNMGISQAVRSSQGIAECRSRKVHTELGDLPVFPKQQEREGVALGVVSG